MFRKISVYLFISAFSFFSTTKGLDFKLSLSGARGTLSSPNYPRNYPLNVTGRWTITVERGHRIAVNFTDFSLEYNKKCLYDYVLIRDVSKGRGNHFSKYCGNYIPPRYYSIGSRIEILFVSDSLNQVQRGFKANWGSFSQEGIKAPKQEKNRIPCPTKTLIQIKTSCPPGLNPSTSQKASIQCCCSQTSNEIFQEMSRGKDMKNHVATPKLDVDLNSNNKRIGEHLHNDHRGAKTRDLSVAFGCLAFVFFLLNIILVIIICRKEGRLAFSYMKSCKTGKHLPPASPDLYYPVFPGPKLKVINGEIVVTNDKKDVIRSIGPEAKSVFSEFSGSTLADGKGEQITSRPRMASIQSSTNFGLEDDAATQDLVSDTESEY